MPPINDIRHPLACLPTPQREKEVLVQEDNSSCITLKDILDPGSLVSGSAPQGGDVGSKFAYSKSLTFPQSRAIITKDYFNRGSLEVQPIERSDFLIDNEDEEDIYEFDISETRNINLSLNNISVGDDANLYLYQDDGDGEFNDNDPLIASSFYSGNRDDAINYQGSEGTYFAHVNYYSSQGDDRINYHLDLSADITGSPSSTLAAEKDFGSSLYGHAAAVETGKINEFNTSDTYGVSVIEGQAIEITLSGLTSNADLRVIQDDNNNNIVDPGEVYLTSTNVGFSSENISLDQEGEYFVEVYQFSGSTNYTLEFDPGDSSTIVGLDPPSTIAVNQVDLTEYYYDLGSLGNQPIERSTYLIENEYEDDIYEFNISETRNLNLSLNSINTGDEANLYLYQDDGDGDFNDSDTLVASSAQLYNSDDAINYQGNEGTYFARVHYYSSDGDDRIDYNLDLSADITGSPSSTLAAEKDFGSALYSDAAAVGTGYISDSNTSETYSVYVVEGEVIEVTLSGLTSDTNLRVIQDKNENNIVDLDEVYLTSTNIGSNSENISLDQDGEYFVEVYQFSGSTDYTLQFDQEFV